MRAICTVCVIVLLVVGCGKKPSPPAAPPTPGQAGSIGETGGAVAPSAGPDGSAPKAAGKADPVFKDYEYPPAAFEDMVTMGNTRSAIYQSPDGLAKVVEFYKQKFSSAGAAVGTSTFFSTKTADGSDLTVTVTKMGEGAQIILKLDKKPPAGG